MSNMSKTKTTKIAITANIGCGKSTISRILRNKGYTVYDTDKISNELTKKDGDAYPLLVQAYPNTLSETLEIDHSKLANICFNNRLELSRLESILHPLILKEMLKLMEGCKDKLVFVEVPLLYEVKWDKYFDDVWLINTKSDIVIKRLIESRHMTKEQIQARLANQMPIETKLLKKNKVINNDGNEEELCKEIESMLHLY
ncbi:MAG: dephospho-CoA kinase [Erysipelotrichaceae bacterium]